MYGTAASTIVAALRRLSEPFVHYIVLHAAIESEINNPHSCGRTRTAIIMLGLQICQGSAKAGLQNRHPSSYGLSLIWGAQGWPTG